MLGIRQAPDLDRKLVLPSAVVVLDHTRVEP